MDNWIWIWLWMDLWVAGRMHKVTSKQEHHVRAYVHAQVHRSRVDV